MNNFFNTYISRMRYTWQHKKSFLNVEKLLKGKNTISGYLHDIDKLVMYFLCIPTKTDANILLALNYLLKENVYIADSVLVGKPYETTQFLNKLNQIIYNFNNNLDTKFVEKMNTLKLVNL